MTALWYASRATGLALLILLTAVVVLGALHSGRFTARRWPRFAIADLHRNLSLLAVVFLVVHIATAIIDPFAGIRWLDAIVPFVSSYEPFWLGLGTLASDLFVALIVSSLVRPRISRRAWRLLHWTAYACWPIALIHGLGNGGADSRLAWVLVLTLTCGVAVLIAVVWRYNARHPDTEARRRPWTQAR